MSKYYGRGGRKLETNNWSRNNNKMNMYRNISMESKIQRFVVIKKLMMNGLKESYQGDIAESLVIKMPQLYQFFDEISQHDKEIIELTMNITFKANKSDSKNENFRKFLQTLANSKFLKKTIDKFISIELNKCENIHLLSSIISFVKILFVNIPGLVYDILYLRVQNLNLIIENLNCRTEPLDKIILQEMEELNIVSNSSNPYLDLRRITRTDTVELSPPDNYRMIEVCPTVDDLLNVTKMEVFLRKNKVKGAYKTVDDYLDVQFRLMREDFIQPIREGLHEYLNPSDRRNFDIRIYEKVFIKYSLPFKKNGIVNLIQFEKHKFRKINWTQSKRFLHGSLLCLSHDNFETLLFATVVERNIKKLEKGQLLIKFNISNPEQDKTYTLLETTNLFDSYRHVLLKLQETDKHNLPMKNYIVFAETEIAMPKYLVDNPNLYYRINGYKVHPGLYNAIWPAAKNLNLDDSQLEAFKSALTNELTIIQGPPGTGKTFLGLKICKTLMENVQSKIEDFGPILVVCYTNHALDQFLEEIVKFSTKIVRVGSRSQSEILQEYNLANLKLNNTYYTDKSFYYEELNSITTSFITFQVKLNLSEKYLIKLKALKDFMIEDHFDYLEKVGLQYWLMGYSQKPFHSEIVRMLDDMVEILLCDEIKKQLVDIVKESFKTCYVKDKTYYDKDLEVNYINNERLLEDDTGEIEELNLQYKNIYLTKLEEFHDDNFCFINNKNTTSAILQSQLILLDEMTSNEANNLESLQNLSINNRWRLYRYWKSKYTGSKNKQLKYIENSYKILNKFLEKSYFEDDRMVMMGCDIIGMTTTGAARYGKVLEKLKCKIIIVEEAAEVLESHIIGSLNAACQHLILIGDHKQLKPSTAVYQLSKKYNLDLSLFERLINNECHYNTLALQHRMRPEIADILKYIYPKLKNHLSVYKYPKVPSISSNMFFFDHNEPEVKDNERMSYSNKFEADFVVKFCKRLLKNGIDSSKITILTLYSGQMILIKQMISRKNDEEVVRVCVVDNYQGEENDIILLSLVRSNNIDKIGFLNIENRICVSLSRAKHGFFVFGNFNLLSNQSQLWRNICVDLKNKSLLGTSLNIYCQIHPEKSFNIVKPSDFDLFPAGGCKEKCKIELKCGHDCRLFCHFNDKDHIEYECLKNCERLCLNNHGCNKICYEKCDACLILIEKVIAECEHKILFYCYKNPVHTDCTVFCERTLACGHTYADKCGNEDLKCLATVIRLCDQCERESEYICSEKSLCKQKCLKTCSNGHPCQLKCNETCKICIVPMNKTFPECNHEQMIPCFVDVEPKDCKTKIEKILNCGHKVIKSCGENVDDIKCKQTCLKLCANGHQCKRLCSQKCEDCKVLMVKKIEECNHELVFPCGKTPQRKYHCKTLSKRTLSCGHTWDLLCSVEYIQCPTEVIKSCQTCGKENKYECHEKSKCPENCSKKCPIGHPCPLKCYETCKDCNVLVKKTLNVCHHEQMIPCGKSPLRRYCKEICKVVLDCGHKRQILCGENNSITLFNLKYRCNEKCTKLCPNGHPCNLVCYKPCVNCETLIPKIINKCKHEQLFPCYKNPENSDCKTEIEYILPCLHKRLVICGELSLPKPSLYSHKSFSKNRKFIKFLQNMKEETNSEDEENVTNVMDCISSCDKLLPCGHLCIRPCKDKCGPCLFIIKDTCPNCGFEVQRKCSETKKKCINPCKTILECGHKCLGNCSVCNNNRLHKGCKNITNIQLICGHQTRDICYQENKSCSQNCQQTCHHKICGNLCGEECEKCIQQCSWKCDHYQCKKLCYEYCDRPICDENCKKKIVCKICRNPFVCYGICGEICNNKCITCQPWLGSVKKYEKNQRFITLSTCGHTFEYKEMDKYMNEPYHNGIIDLKRCKICQTAITNRSCFRYSNIIKIISLDIKRVQMLFHQGSQCCKDIRKTIENRSYVMEMFQTLRIDNYFMEIETLYKSKKLNNFTAITINISLNLVKIICQTIFPSIKKYSSSPNRDYIRESIKHLIKWSNPFERCFNNFELYQFHNEFHRINFICQLSKENDGTIDNEIFDEFISQLKTIKQFSEPIAKQFHKKVLLSNPKFLLPDHSKIILEKSNQLHKGVWLKCKRGHYYVDIEGTIRARCPRCLHI